MINYKDKTLILFDIDDTLFDNHDYKLKSRKLSLTKLKQELKKYNIQISFEELNQRLDDFYHQDNSSHNLYEQLLSTFNLPENIRTKLAIKCVVEHRRAKQNLKTLPNTKQVLNNLQKKGYLLGIVSSGSEFRQFEKLTIIDIIDFFDLNFVFITGKINSNERKNSKDDKFFKYIKNNVAKYNFKKIYMIGNKFETDILTSYKVGFSPILIKSYCYTKQYQINCNKLNIPIIFNLKEILNIIE